MKPGLLEDIKSRGHWRVNVRPSLELSRPLELRECLRLVRENSVQLRGWYYPYVSDVRKKGQSDMAPMDSYYESWVDFWNFREFWRMYISGQFLHYFAVREDWYELRDPSWQSQLHMEPGTGIGVTGSIVYELTEIYEFVRRLCQSNLYSDRITISIQLHNTAGRSLLSDDPRKLPFFQNFVCQSEKIDFFEDARVSEMIESSQELSNRAILHFLDRFGWHNPNASQIKLDQEALLTRRAFA